MASNAYPIGDAMHFADINHNFMLDSNFYPNFQEDLQKFRTQVKQQVENKKSATYIHFGDGDGHFLQCNPVGSACPGRRALSKPYSQLDMERYRKGFLNNTYICVEKFEPFTYNFYTQIFQRPVDIHTEFIYGSVADRWFTREFRGKIGLIGAKEKLDLIEKLLEHKEYQDYLGLESFEDYIYVPQRFACDDLDATCDMVKQQLTSATSDIFLFGVGHVKSGLVQYFPDWKLGVYIDVGSGIDALAGIIDPFRPYMYTWKNHRVRGYPYQNLDYLQYSPNGQEITLE